jgi:hypothetical protein
MKKLSLLFAVLAIAGFVTLAGAASRIERNLKLEPNGRFLIDSDGGSVTLTGVASSGARIVITSDRSDLESLYTITFQENAGSAGVTARRKDHSGFGFFNWGHGDGLHFEVQVPSQTQTDIRTGGGSVETSNLRGDSRLRTSGGPIVVSALTGRLDAATSGGPIRLREITGDTRLGTSGGPIEVASLEGSLDAHTSGGPIHVDRVTGSVEARTSGGPITVNFGRGNSHGGWLETSGGPITVAVERTANLEIDASTSGGSVVTDLPVQRHGSVSRSSLQGTLGSGGSMLRLRTSGGSIHIGAL